MDQTLTQTLTLPDSGSDRMGSMNIRLPSETYLRLRRLADLELVPVSTFARRILTEALPELEGVSK